MTEGHGVGCLVFGCWVLARAVAISIEATLFEWWGSPKKTMLWGSSQGVPPVG